MIASVVIVIVGAIAAAFFIIRKYCCLKRYRDIHCVLYETVQPNLSILSPKYFAIIYTKDTWQLNLNKMCNLVFIYNIYNIMIFFSLVMQHIDTQNCNKWKSKMQPEKWRMIQMRLVCKQWFITAFKIWYLITFYSYTSFSFHRTFWTESCSTIYSSHFSSFLILWLYMAKSITWVI